MIYQTLEPFFNLSTGIDELVIDFQGLITACITLESIMISILRLSCLGLF